MERLPSSVAAFAEMAIITLLLCCVSLVSDVVVMFEGSVTSVMGSCVTLAVLVVTDSTVDKFESIFVLSVM